MTKWLPVPGCEGSYEVSDLGDVRSLARVVSSTGRGGRRTIYPRLLKPTADKDGYPFVTLTRDGRAKLMAVHRLVALAFHGDKRNSLHKQVSHLDGNRANPRADNLKWVSHRENETHKLAHGTILRGEQHPSSKLSEETAREILARAKAGEMPRRLGREYGIHEKHVAAIRDGRLWKHLDVFA